MSKYDEYCHTNIVENGYVIVDGLGRVPTSEVRSLGFDPYTVKASDLTSELREKEE